jgi:hypothetical protein
LGAGSNLTRNAKFLANWVTGTGERKRKYRPGDPQLRDMMQSPGADYLRGRFAQNGCNDITAWYRTGRAAFDTLLNPFTANPWRTSAQVGGFTGSVSNNGDGTATYNITNTAGTRSFFYHMVPDRTSPTGPMSNIDQSFAWSEPLPCR